MSVLYVVGRDTAAVAALLGGLKPAALVVVLPAVRRIGGKIGDTRWKWAVAALAFGAAALRLPYPLVVLGAGLTGLWLSTARAEGGGGPWPSGQATAQRLGVGVALWWAPVAAAAIALGPGHAVVEVGLVFSVVAVVTFGGAYAVLGMVAHEGVERFGWLSHGEMLDGLAFAETMPGPLVLVLQHVGFMAGWNQPGDLRPAVAALLGAAMASWVTFVPSFTWVLVFAPYVEALRGNQRARAALDGVGAAVLGVLAHLVAWFAWGVLDGPGPWLVLGACGLAGWLSQGSVGLVLATGLLGGVLVQVAGL